jgi:hypothetical protein
MDLLVAIAINGAFWVLVSEGIYALWISQAKNAGEKTRRSKSKAVNWDGRWRWALIALVVIASASQYV